MLYTPSMGAESLDPEDQFANKKVPNFCSHFQCMTELAEQHPISVGQSCVQ